jgi:MFS family permease
MTALCGLAQSYLHLLLLRVGVGIGEAGASPAAQSLLSDYFPPDKRASAFSVFAFGGPVGALFGTIAAGIVAQSHGWRAAFFLVGVPGLALALLFKLTTREPARGSQDPAGRASTIDPTSTPSLWSVTRHLFGRPTFVHIVIGAAVANFALQGILQFTAASFVRRFGVGMGEVGLAMGLISGLCGGLGILAGGFGADWAGRRDPRWYVWLPAGGLLCCGPFYAAAFLQGTWTASTAMLLLPSALSYIFIAPMLSVTQNLVGPRMRATAVALLTLVTASVGVAIGPILVGWLSDILATRSFAGSGLGSYSALCYAGGFATGPGAVRAACAASAAVGVQQAIIASTVMFLWAGIHFLLAARTIRRDLAHSEAIAMQADTTKTGVPVLGSAQR